MLNKDRQKSLDRKKWVMSEEIGEDLSGEMWYCFYCSCSMNKKCIATQEEREKGLLCAKAYNRLARKNLPKQ